jgi:hypothetical protein
MTMMNVNVFYTSGDSHSYSRAYSEIILQRCVARATDRTKKLILTQSELETEALDL